MSSSQLAAGA